MVAGLKISKHTTGSLSIPDLQVSVKIRITNESGEEAGEVRDDEEGVSGCEGENEE